MNGTRIAIDGLWRCLCPSFDAIAASQLTGSLSPASTRKRLYTAKQTAKSVLYRSIHSSTKLKLQDQDDATVAVRHIEPSKTSSIINKSSPADASLDDVPVRELYDTLRNIGTKNGAYKSITELVDYLITSRGERPSLPIYDALIRANADASRGSADAVANLLREVKENKIVPDSNLYHSALQALAIHPDYLLRSEVLREMKDRWYTITTEGWHYLVVGLLRDRQYEIALDKLEQMQQQRMRVHPWLYDIFIYLFCNAEELDEALKILQYRTDQGDMDISSNIWYYMLDACSTNYHYQGTEYVWRKRVETGYLNPSDGICSNVLNTAARHEDPGLATDVVRVLTERTSKLDIHHYEALISASAKSSDLKTSLQILSIMKRALLEPTEATTRSIFDSLSKNPKLPSESFKIIRSLSQRSHAIPTAAVNVIIEASIAHGDLKEGIEYYKALHEVCPSGPNTATFNVLLQGCSRSSGNKNLAMFLASEMANLGVRPNVLTYDRLVLVCLRDDNYDDAFRYIEEMKAMYEGSELRTGTYHALIKKCVAAGDKRAWDILEDMQSRGHNVEKIKRWVEGEPWNGTEMKAMQPNEREKSCSRAEMG